MTRSPLVLAALATAAVPGLQPVSTWSPPEGTSGRFDVAFLADDRDRSWVVRSPRSSADGALLDGSALLLRLVGRRLPFKVPAPAGFVPVPEGRVMVYPMLPGRPIDLTKVPPGVGLATALGRALAAIHNVDRGLFEEAGVPTYDAEEYRQRRLAELDQGAGTGHVPTGLLARWEKALEDVAIWRFAPTPVHGSLAGDRMLVSFGDAEDVASGTVAAVTGWELAKIADPADDWAAIVSECPPDVVDDIRDGYRSVLIERADPHLVVRAHLAGELSLMRRLLNAVGAADITLTTTIAGQLRRLDQFLAATNDDALSLHVYRDDLPEPWAGGRHAAAGPATPAAPVAADERPADDSVALDESPGADADERLADLPAVADGQGAADEAAELGATQPIDLAELDALEALDDPATADLDKADADADTDPDADADAETETEADAQRPTESA